MIWTSPSDCPFSSRSPKYEPRSGSDPYPNWLAHLRLNVQPYFAGTAQHAGPTALPGRPPAPSQSVPSVLFLLDLALDAIRGGNPAVVSRAGGYRVPCGPLETD